MMDMAYPLHLIDLLAKLYRKQLTKVKVVEKHYQKGLSPLTLHWGQTLYPCWH